jgi:hypothetical protein
MLCYVCLSVRLMSVLSKSPLQALVVNLVPSVGLLTSGTGPIHTEVLAFFLPLWQSQAPWLGQPFSAA